MRKFLACFLMLLLVLPCAAADDTLQTNALYNLREYRAYRFALPDDFYAFGNGEYGSAALSLFVLAYDDSELAAELAALLDSQPADQSLIAFEEMAKTLLDDMDVWSMRWTEKTGGCYKTAALVSMENGERYWIVQALSEKGLISFMSTGAGTADGIDLAHGLLKTLMMIE